MILLQFEEHSKGRNINVPGTLRTLRGGWESIVPHDFGGGRISRLQEIVELLKETSLERPRSLQDIQIRKS
jgi:hypothetical protein